MLGDLGRDGREWKLHISKDKGYSEINMEIHKGD